MLKVGESIPQFSLPDQNGTTHTAAEYRGKWLIIYFYPKDDTPGCTTETCSFRDAYGELQKAGVTVVGISKDSAKSHQKFAAKYQLPFTLLSDVEKTTIDAFGALGMKKFMGREFVGVLRTTFLIDPHGKIAKVYENVKPDQHVDEILEDFKELQK